MSANTEADHGALMDGVYRYQRHFYDLTRKYFLFGRDTLIAGMDAAPGQNVLEIACGTGRNLAMIARRWPGVRLHGLDISANMLCTARKVLGTGTLLSCADATNFDGRARFGLASFDRVILSYSLSMIPDWRSALAQAARHVAPGGSLHVVDFGDCLGLPTFARNLLHRWLARFHVTARKDLVDAAQILAQEQGLVWGVKRGPLGYYTLLILRRPTP